MRLQWHSLRYVGMVLQGCVVCIPYKLEILWKRVFANFVDTLLFGNSILHEHLALDKPQFAVIGSTDTCHRSCQELVIDNNMRPDEKATACILSLVNQTNPPIGHLFLIKHIDGRSV